MRPAAAVDGTKRRRWRGSERPSDYAHLLNRNRLVGRSADDAKARLRCERPLGLRARAERAGKQELPPARSVIDFARPLQIRRRSDALNQGLIAVRFRRRRRRAFRRNSGLAAARRCRRIEKLGLRAAGRYGCRAAPPPRETSRLAAAVSTGGPGRERRRIRSWPIALFGLP